MCVAAEWEQDAGGAAGGGDEKGSAAAEDHKRRTAEGESGSGRDGGVPASPGETGRGAGGGGHALGGGGGRGSAREREREAWLERERGRLNEEMCVEDLLPSVVFSRDRKRDVEREYGVPPLPPAYGGAPVHAAGMSRLVLEGAGEGRARWACVRDSKSSAMRAGEEQVVLEQDEDEDEDENEDEDEEDDDDDAGREEENARGKEPCRPRSLLFYTFHPIL